MADPVVGRPIHADIAADITGYWKRVRCGFEMDANAYLMSIADRLDSAIDHAVDWSADPIDIAINLTATLAGIAIDDSCVRMATMRSHGRNGLFVFMLNCQTSHRWVRAKMARATV